MKCPECIKQGKRSRVHSMGGSTTLMGGGGTFWDEDGVEHDHDPNWTTWGYRCSDGHSFARRTKRRCPAKNCSFNDDIEEEFEIDT